LIASLVIGFGNGIGSGMVMTLGADYSPSPGRAHFLGVWRLLSDVGASSGPALLSALTATLSLAAGIVSTGLLGLTAAGSCGTGYLASARASRRRLFPTAENALSRLSTQGVLPRIRSGVLHRRRHRQR
jgi:MFS family permease